MEEKHSSKNKNIPNVLLNFLKRQKTHDKNEHVPKEIVTEKTTCKNPNQTIVQTESLDERYDIGNFLSISTKTEESVVTILEKIWQPSENYKFPVNEGQHRRKFNYTWLKKFYWVAYSKKLNGAFCKYCVFFATQFAGQSSSQCLGALVSEPFRAWKKALERFEHHETSKYHQFSVLRAENLKENLKKNISIHGLLDTASVNSARKNREKLGPIIKTVMFCGRMGLPLRGHRDFGSLEFNSTIELQNNIDRSEGNFRNLLKLRMDAGDQIIKNHLETAGANATYISWGIQNEILEICNKIIIKKLVTEVNAAKAFVVLADETTDVSNKEQLTLCVRYVHNNKLHEKFLQFVEIKSLTGEALALSIIGSLEALGLNLKSLCGQGYDGAAAMSGHIKGAQKIISDKFPAATYVHCAAHNLNLCLSGSSNVVEIRNSLGVIEKCYAFFNTPKRENVLIDKINELTPDSKKHGLKKLCPTRWVERHDAVLVMEELYTPVCAALEEIENWADRATSSEASLLGASLKTAKFTISLLCLKTVFAYTLPLSKFLQKIDLNLCSALDLAKTVTDQLKEMRINIDVIFSTIFTEAESLLKQYDVDIKIPRLPARQTQRLVVSDSTTSDYFKITIFIPFLDSLITNLDERFLKYKDIIKLFTVLFPCFEKIEENIQAFLNLHKFYNTKNFFETFSNDALLTAEFRLWNEKYKNRTTKLDASQLYVDCNEIVFPNIKKLLQIFITLPVTTATSERSFSDLKYLKSYLRNTTSQNRLNGMAMLYINKDFSLSCEEVLDEMAKPIYKRRLNLIL